MDGLPTTVAVPVNGEPAAAARAGSAYNTLKLELLEGELAPGDNLVVVDLAHRFECSRVPVMEALKRLEGEGFVRIVPQVGCKVVTPVIADVIDFFLLFAAVEGTVARLAAERRTLEDLVQFRSICAQVDERARLAGEPQDHDPAYRRLNLLFHTEIHRMASSPVASRIASSLWDRSDFYIKTVFGSLYFSKSVVRAHRRIRKAIIVGDSLSAEAAIRAHLTRVGEGVARQMRRDSVAGD